MSDDQTVERLIQEKYPFPISHAYVSWDRVIDPEERYQALLACFEVTLKTIASISLANFVRDVQQDNTLGNANLFQDLYDILSQPISLGHWQELLRLTLRPYANRRDQLAVPELFGFYYRITDAGNVRAQSRNVQLLQRFIQERNEEAHHRNRSQTSPLQRQSQLARLEEDLRSLLEELDCLAQYPWLYVEDAEYHQGKWHYRTNYLRGTAYPFRQDTWRTSLGINSRRCVLMDESRSDILELAPFVIVTPEGKVQQPEIFFFDGIFASGRANFMSYHISDYIDPTDEGSPASVASDAIHSLLKLLQNRLPPSAEEVDDRIEEPFSPIEIYRQAVSHALDKGEGQMISLDALRKILNLPREEALQQERELETERGVEIEPEAEIPFEGDPTWANLAYYVLDGSGQEEMAYTDIALEAAALKDKHDPDWQKGDSASVAATVSHVMSSDPRFYKLERGRYRLTKNNELLSNPSWANLAYFVLQQGASQQRGMHLSEITRQAVALKENYSDWHPDDAQTPRNTLSATMSMDHRFESMPRRGYWRLAEQSRTKRQAKTEKASRPTNRHTAYDALLERLAQLGKVEPLPFGKTYYALDDQVHIMLRFSKAHELGNEVEYFMSVSPQYFERIHTLGKGFLAFVMGKAENVLLVPTTAFAKWVEGLEPSGSGVWLMSFYQRPNRRQVLRWVRGENREDVTQYLNNYAAVREALPDTTGRGPKFAKTSFRVPDLLQAGLLKPGDVIYTKKRPSERARVIDDKQVQYKGRPWKYTEWGTHVTGWSAINIYREVIVDRTGETLDMLRKRLTQLREGSS
jgi:hypothetical protein